MTALGRAARLVDDYLLAWVLAAVAVGFLVPELAVLTPLSLPLLAVMVGSVSLTLSVTAFRAVDRRALGATLLVQPVMVLLAVAAALALSLPAELALGFVVLGAVTPELVTPTMTELADGDTALSTTVLVVMGAASLVLVPGAVALFGGGAPVRAWGVVENLLLAVVGPMALAVALRERHPDRVARGDHLYPSVSALMVVVVIGIVTAANADVVRANRDLLPPVVAGALALNLGGYGLGWAVGLPFDRATRVASTLSVGMRDFAVAAALVVAAGFPPATALPAVVFGVVEMASSAALAHRTGR